MYSRTLKPPATSCFLFGPRGTGKSTWVRGAFPDSLYLDLLESELYHQLLASPQRLDALVPRDHHGWIVIDEVQRIPAILDEVHRQIETHRRRFVLTGSSARKLRRGGVNLLAGRARTLTMHPLTVSELGGDFTLRRALEHGCLPSAWTVPDPRAYLDSYVATYLKEEVQQEGLTRNLGAFARFLEAASFSQASLLNISQVARECSVHRKVVEEYFGILDDLLLASRVPVFARRARRATTAHPKFYLFDAGVYRAVRPKGPLDSREEIDGAALETLVYQQVAAVNAARGLGYTIHYWRTTDGREVDLVLYGERGLVAIEVKRAAQIRPKDLKGLTAFLVEYPEARSYLAYGGSRRYREGPIDVVPVDDFLRGLEEVLG